MKCITLFMRTINQRELTASYQKEMKKKKNACITFRLSGSTPENIVGCILFPARDKKYFNTQRCVVY